MKLGLGTVQFGIDYGVYNKSKIISDFEVNKILNTANKFKISYIDTAQDYGNSEKKIGKFDTSDFKIITKISKDVHYDDVRKSIEGSLNRLKVKKVNGVLIHSFSHFIKNNRVYKKLIDLKKKGLILNIGFSLYYPEELKYLLDNKIDFDFIQIPYNIFDRRFESYFEFLKSVNIEIHVRSVFLQGLFFIDPLNLSNFFRHHINHFISFRNEIQKNKISVQSACLNYVCNNEYINCVLIGVENNNQLVENINAIDNKLNLKFLDKFKINDEKILLPYNWK
jgi:aryl-alcohol dehydrogenase-like predicted oxidoreductase